MHTSQDLAAGFDEVCKACEIKMFISHSKICLNYIKAFLLNVGGKRESIMFVFLFLIK